MKVKISQMKFEIDFDTRTPTNDPVVRSNDLFVYKQAETRAMISKESFLSSGRGIIKIDVFLKIEKILIFTFETEKDKI